ncbi:class I SAM-dependent methyltransferase [bacterium]|nr:MAG: class I SAM-dependent methyltransferase [bacterium]
MSSEPVASDGYTEEYFRSACGGAEFYALYGPRVPKPQLAYALRLGELRPGLSVLDVGCGRGELLHLAGAAGATAVGTDYAEAALRLARDNGGGRVARCDAKALPFADASFDRVFLLGVVDHLHRWELEACFAELARVLRPGGFVVLHNCANRLHYKALTYAARRRAAALLAGLGLPVRAPSPPRSEEDEAMHVNEHSAGDLRRLFDAVGWDGAVEPMPNYKALVAELYGPDRPADLPLKAYPAWRAALAKALARSPAAGLTAREFFAVARPRGRA